LAGPNNISRNTATDRTKFADSGPIILVAMRSGRFLHESYRQAKYSRVRREWEAIKMKLILAILFVEASACCAAQSIPEVSYYAMLKGDGHTWCAYKDSDEFKAEAAAVKPSETARVSFVSSKLTDLTYQIEAESGDWIVIDKYTPSNMDVLVRRANLLAQENLQIIQQAVIHGGIADAFHLVNVTTLDGKKTELPPKTDFPNIPVKTDLLALPFMGLVNDLQQQTIKKLCK